MQKLINSLINQKYKNTLLSKKNISFFLRTRIKFLDFDFKDKTKHEFYKKTLNRKNNIQTDDLLRNLFFKEKLNNKEKEILHKFYKKFSVHLRLLKFYDKFLKPKSNIETNYHSYIYLGSMIKNLKKINKIQKLNFLLKLNDKVFINSKKIKDKYLIDIFKKNVRTELNLIKFFTK